MSFDNDEESLEFINRLLERLHQAGDKTLGGNMTIVIVKPGAQHVETIQTQNIVYPDSPKRREKGTGKLPDVLRTEEAMVLWEKAQAAGYVDANYQSLISRTQAAILADEIAERLEIKEKWKAFETLWNRRNMYRDYHDALNQRQSLQFRDKLRELFR